jgi:hypothetical protein
MTLQYASLNRADAANIDTADIISLNTTIMELRTTSAHHRIKLSTHSQSAAPLLHLHALGTESSDPIHAQHV